MSVSPSTPQKKKKKANVHYKQLELTERENGIQWVSMPFNPEVF